MTASGFLTVAPVVEGSMAEAVASAVEAIEGTGVTYETTPMGTLIEAESAADLFAAAEAAHAAVDADRVSTFLKIDDKRTGDEPMAAKVEAVEDALGRPARSDRRPGRPRREPRVLKARRAKTRVWRVSTGWPSSSSTRRSTSPTS